MQIIILMILEKNNKETIKTLENNIEWFGLYGKNLVIEIKI